MQRLLALLNNSNLTDGAINRIEEHLKQIHDEDVDG